jgi:hypothetical protein
MSAQLLGFLVAVRDYLGCWSKALLHDREYQRVICWAIVLYVELLLITAVVTVSLT